MKVPHTVDDWRTSSYSAQETDCVQVHRRLAALRDSKNPLGPVLTADLRPLVNAIKGDRVD